MATVIGIVALLGLAKLLPSSLYVLALLRHRATIPFMYVLIVSKYLGHKGIGWMKPIVHMAGTSTGSLGTLGIFALNVIGLVFSLRGEGYLAAQDGRDLSHRYGGISNPQKNRSCDSHDQAGSVCDVADARCGATENQPRYQPA